MKQDAELIPFEDLDAALAKAAEISETKPTLVFTVYSRSETIGGGYQWRRGDGAPHGACFRAMATVKAGAIVWRREEQ